MMDADGRRFVRWRALSLTVLWHVARQSRSRQKMSSQIKEQAVKFTHGF
jgi:hypothetical protein